MKTIQHILEAYVVNSITQYTSRFNLKEGFI
ncbi:hypothetical protein OTSGILL_1349 [Orientia tsutsugamushi str. Gilliam]|uniref:Uncharacterized protein n=2 Tax=Orientia tsutsugamushi TaxID=784 RepID=A0A0F3MDP1_ORITS|nr:hypothetical protein OTSGILL_1349 [Orientia tsutsugamushi str. Gilliam]KJV54357.1 hypothetical protein OTSKATO_1125 [Orientia tsutsugamushi str. Kato PP]SPR12100.1 Uncharacterised protein [Orientia tsutsugamushi str. Gilliam]SPR13282.1 Uncharacterised protein [Orientia tsutsugamushi]